MQYERMLPAELDAVLRTRPIAYLPWGAHEWHGVHNAVGLDALKAHAMALALCRETGGVVLPPVYCGYQTMKPWAEFRHTLEFSKDLVRRYVREHLENLCEEGFRVVVLIMGHYGAKHVETVRAGFDDFTERHSRSRVLAITDYEPASWCDVAGADHAGLHETSLLMHFHPELVDLTRLPARPLDDARDGCTPDAGGATAEHGAELVRVFVAQAAPRVRELLAEALAAWPLDAATH